MTESVTSRRPAAVDATAGSVRSGSDVVGEYFLTHRSSLAGIARNLAGTVMDPQDLLSDALVSALSRGRGHTIENIGAYLYTAMRNRVRDELRSPRSRVVTLHEESLRDETAPFSRIDLIRERTLVQRALATLPDDQRRALVGVAVDRIPARELTIELDRPAPAIHSLVNRAKGRLRRALLREALLESNPGPDCVVFVNTLPDLTRTDPEAGAARWRNTHLGGCAPCTNGWDRFTAAVSTLTST